MLIEYAEIVREVSLGLPPNRVYTFPPAYRVTAEQAAMDVLRARREHGLPSVIWADAEDVARWCAEGYATFWGIQIKEHPGRDGLGAIEQEARRSLADCPKGSRRASC
jgi:hypothetical protein